jgi:hypothetical protein
MTDTPKRFPYGGGPARYVNPALAKARGFEVAELPGDAVYAEPAYDVEVDDGSPSLRTDPGADLDFDAGFEGALSPYDRPSVEPVGVSAYGHLLRDVFAYPGWECDCKATAKTGIPPRHYVQYRPELVWALGPHKRVMIAPGRGEIRQAKGGEQAVETEAFEDVAPVECPTARWVMREWVRPARDWSKGKHGIKAPVEVVTAEPVPVEHPAGPTTPIESATMADFPPRCTAKSLAGYAETMHKVSGRMTDDGPLVNRLRLAGTTPDGARWVAEWTDGKFASARFNGSLVNLAMLRKAVKEPGAAEQMTLI